MKKVEKNIYLLFLTNKSMVVDFSSNSEFYITSMNVSKRIINFSGSMKIIKDIDYFLKRHMK